MKTEEFFSAVQDVHKEGVMADRDNAAKTEKGRKMWKFKAIVIGFLGFFIFGGLAQVYAAKEDSNTRIYEQVNMLSLN